MASPSRDMHPTSLTSLPFEILKLICQSLCAHCWNPSACPSRLAFEAQYEGISALKTVSETCKTLKSIAQPIMFHRPCLHIRTHKLGSFVRLVRQRPDLANCVKQICSEMHESSKQDISEEDKEYMVSLAPELRLNSTNDHDLNFLGYFLTDLLLALLPNIECLMVDVEGYLEVYEELDRSWFGHRCEMLSRDEGSAALPKLRMLRIAMTDSHGFPADHIGLGVLLRAAPNVENITIWGLNYIKDDYSGDYDLETFMPQFKKLRALDLRSCELLPDEDDRLYLQKLVNHTDQLQKLRYWTHDRSQWGFIGFSALQLLDVLIETSCNETLVHLDLDLDVADSEWQTEDRQRQIGPLLGQFPNLKTLKLDERSFCRHWLPPPHCDLCGDTCISRMLPSSVRIFIIRAMEDCRALDDIIHLSGEITVGKFPSLECLGIDVRRARRSKKSFAKFSESIPSFFESVESSFSGTEVRVNVHARIIDPFREWSDGIQDYYDADLGLLGGVPGEKRLTSDITPSSKSMQIF